MESCSLHPVQLRPAGWSSICLWLWLRIKAGDRPPQLVTAPSPVTAWSLTVWGRKMVKLAAASVELAFAKSYITFSWIELWAEAKKGDVPPELVLVSAGCISESVALMPWITKSQQHQHRGVVAVSYSRAQVVIQWVKEGVPVLLWLLNHCINYRCRWIYWT